MSTKKKTKKTEPAKETPKSKVDCFSVVMSSEELIATAQVLSFAKEIFEQMAVNSHKDGDEKSVQVYAARAKLSSMLYEKFKTVAEIGEPASQLLH